MPLVRVEMMKGKSPEYKKNVLDIVHEGLMEAIGIEDWDRFQRISEYDRTNFEYPSFKSENFMIIEITLFPGRTREQKGRAIEIISQRLGDRLGIDPGDVFILFSEPPLENWGLGGKQKG